MMRAVWGIENSGSLGKGFAQFLLADGETDVREVSPHRTAQYRRRGRTQDKTDAADALAIARLIGAEGEQLPSVQADDLSTELRLLSDHRDNLVAERTRLINQLHAQMLQIDPCYMEKSGALTSRDRRPLLPRRSTCRTPMASLRTRLLIVRQLTGQILAVVGGDRNDRNRPPAASAGDGDTAAATLRRRHDRGGTADRRTGLHAAHPLRRRARRARRDRAGRGLVGRTARAPAQSGWQSATERAFHMIALVPVAL